MWKGKKRFVWLAIGLIVLPMLSASTQEQELVFEDSFDDPGLPGWEHSPEVFGSNGAMRIEPGNFAIRPGAWGDVRIVAEVRWEGEGEFVLGSRSSGDGGYFLLVGRDYVVAQREQAGELTEQAAVGGIPIPYQNWFQLKIILEGGYQQVYIDEVLVLEAEDPAPLFPGAIIFETLGAAALEVGYLAVYTLASSSPPPEEIVPAPEEGSPSPEGSTVTFEGDLTWVRTGGPLGGLGYDVRMHPDNPDIMYVTDALAGVFKSTDGGKNWFPSNEGITVRIGPSGDDIPIFCLTIDPQNPETVWVGTQNKRGIFKSENGGASWAMKVNGIVESEGITFRGITVDPNNSQTIYAAAEIDGWVWSGQEQIGREFSKTKGVVYKSTNSGENWQAIWRGENLARYILIDPRDSNVLYISTGIFDREAANSDHTTNTPGGEGVLKSTDGGQTWTKINNGLTNLYIGTLFMHPENPDILLAGAANNAYRENAGVFLTTDGGQSWTRVLEDEAQSVEFSTSNPQIAYAGNPASIYRSEDGGFTWKMMLEEEGGWGPPGVEPGFPIDFQVDPRNPDRIFANNYGGGNFLSEDGGRTWIDASTGYTGALMRKLATSPTEPGVVYAAGRSGIFFSNDGGGHWVGLVYPESFGLDWNAVAIDQQDPQHILGANNWTQSLYESHDGGLSWKINQFPDLTMQGGRVIVFAPSDPQVAYAGFGAFYSAGTFDDTIPASGAFVSRDGGSTWSAASDSLTASINVSDLAVHPTDPQLVYLASPASGLFMTKDGGTNWTKLNNLPGGVRPLSITLDPANPDHILTGSEGQGLYQSGDGGQTWSQVSAGIPPEAVIKTIVFHPTTSGIVFIGDSFSGVYRSSDGGQTWLAMSDGLHSRAVTSLAISADGWHLYAGTEGGGVFRLDLNGQPPATGTPLFDDNPPDGAPPEEGEPPSEPGSPPEENPSVDHPGDAPAGPILPLGIIIGAIIAALAVVVIIVMARRRRT